jgi:zinc transport system permease protein
MLLLVLLALVITVAMKAVGSLLITALLVMPSLVARPLASNPHGMALLAAFTGMIAVSGGLASSFYWDTPVGPSIVLSCCVIIYLGTVSNSDKITHGMMYPFE